MPSATVLALLLAAFLPAAVAGNGAASLRGAALRAGDQEDHMDTKFSSFAHPLSARAMKNSCKEPWRLTAILLQVSPRVSSLLQQLRRDCVILLFGLMELILRSLPTAASKMRTWNTCAQICSSNQFLLIQFSLLIQSSLLIQLVLARTMNKSCKESWSQCC